MYNSTFHPPIVSLSVSIGVVSGREGTFRVTCRATGGTLSTSSLTGPGLGGGGLQLQAEGSIGRTGKNTYSVTSGTLSGRSNGDTYTCTALNDVSSPEISAMLAGTIQIYCMIIVSGGITSCNTIIYPNQCTLYNNIPTMCIIGLCTLQLAIVCS